MDLSTPVLGTLSTMGDDQQLTTTRLLQHAARTLSTQTIDHKVADGGWATSSYAELWERVRRVSAGLRTMGIGPGDHVGLLLWNDIRHLESYFSIPLLGATMVQLNLRLAPADLAYVINHAGVKTIIVDETLLDLARVLRPHLSENTHWIVCSDADASAGRVIGAEFDDYETMVRGNEPLADIPTIHERTASGACYTTGTTGNPKGVLYSHRSTWLHSFAVISGLGMTMQDTVMCLTSMFHAQCWGLPYAAVASGARLVLPGRFSLADTPALTDAIVERGVTIAPAAPAILLPMLRHLQEMPVPPRLDGVRLLCGASEPPVSMMKGFDSVCGAEVIHAYGATETSPIVSLNRLKPELKDELDEASQWELKRYQGLVVVGVDLKIVDPLGNPLAPGEENIGEICVRGPWITASYAGNATGTPEFVKVNEASGSQAAGW